MNDNQRKIENGRVCKIIKDFDLLDQDFSFQFFSHIYPQISGKMDLNKS